tara:strand:+ start:1557 stop:1823 length:267 start_codon:yes stop_codon:yes gene_type:complete
MTEPKQLYKPFKSKAKNKKMSVYVMKNGKKKLIHFGDNRYRDYTQGASKEQRKSYLARARGIRDKQGNLTANNKNSSNYWSIKVLWKG